MATEQIQAYLNLTQAEVVAQLKQISARHLKERQSPFLPIETLLCYGLFFILNPHSYGGANMHTVPPAASALATFFRRKPGSITSKMLNLDGSRTHSAKAEPHLFAYLANHPDEYLNLYRLILNTARELNISEESIPDFLEESARGQLLAQEELPVSLADLLRDNESELKTVEQRFELGEELTEKLVEQKVRLAQHRFARAVLANCANTCVFCGFSLPLSGLLRASHIKPWAVSSARERVDVKNGLAACPTHDAAFDYGYITVNGGYKIHQAQGLIEKSTLNPKAALYFREALSPKLILPPAAAAPATAYLAYHNSQIFKSVITK